MPIFRQNGHLRHFCSKFAQKWILDWKSRKCCNKNQHPRDTMCANFQAKQTTLTFSAQICPKLDFGVGISKI